MNLNSEKASLGVVVIGRNEGTRLEVCIRSIMGSSLAPKVFYVDSGSTDGSVKLAERLGCEIINLDLSVPFTAARARNEGFDRALQVIPGLEFIQFVDGDCELASRWLDEASMHLRGHASVVVVCGRRRERHPDSSTYNMLCDLEWDSPIGSVNSCGGDAMMRASALLFVGGYRADLIAGEEPELCVRLRANGGVIWRLDREMTLHDAAMFKFSQWWSRSKRAGYAYAQGAYLHGGGDGRHCVRAALRSVIWGFIGPLAIAVLSIFNVDFLLLLIIYPLHLVRMVHSSKHRSEVAWIQSFFLVIGKFAEAHGVIKFISNKILSKTATLIEYK